MLTWIVAHSDSLCNFLTPLLIGFSPAQIRHAPNCVEALWVCASKHMTLSALTRLLRLPHADQFAIAGFFHASLWESVPIQQALTMFLLQIVCAIQPRTGWRLLFLRIDDALCPKDVATRALEAVTFHFDHCQSRRQKGNFTKSSRYVTLGLQLGPVQFVLGWRLYLPRKLVKQLNRTRTGETKLTFYKLTTRIEQMLDEIVLHLPTGCRVYVLFDAWYDNQHLQEQIRTYGWHWICATRSNRSLSDRPLSHWWLHMNHCSDTPLRVRTIVKSYGYRGQAGVDNGFLKERFGFADFRVQSVEAIGRWHTLVFAA